MKKYFSLATISGILLAIAWPTYGFAFFAFFGLIPILYLVEEINSSAKKRKGLYVFSFGYLAFFIWNIATTWWIVNSTIFGAAFAILCNSSFYAIMLCLYRWVLTRVPKITATLFFISLWLSFEKFHLNWDFSWPWLNLGNVFSEHILWIQWYEYTGVFGGSLWVLLLNFIGLRWFREYQQTKSIRNSLKGYLPNLLWIALPIAFSLVIYINIDPVENKTAVLVLQPNLDPYQDKYQFSNQQLLSLAKDLTQKFPLESIDFFLAPEGYLDEGAGFNLNNYQQQSFYKNDLKAFLQNYPRLNFISGVQTYRLYAPSSSPPTPTANLMQRGGWYDVYNSAFQFNDLRQDQVYHKSKLVVGVEFMPYKTFFEPLIGEFLLDFGGTIATRATQKKRTVFEDPKGIKTAPIICYESIYGSFVTEYVRKGAEFLSIITNDAWWGATQGHQQLLSYARLRAIENRRAIARSANTGISAFINAKGEIEQTLAYNQTGALLGHVERRNKLTFYTQYGDYLARWGIFLSMLTFCMAISGRLKEKI